jgi:hypothetical protein
LLPGSDEAAEDPGSIVDVDTLEPGIGADPGIDIGADMPRAGSVVDLGEDSGVWIMLSEQTCSGTNPEEDPRDPCGGAGAAGAGPGTGTEGDATTLHEAGG